LKDGWKVFTPAMTISDPFAEIKTVDRDSVDPIFRRDWRHFEGMNDTGLAGHESGSATALCRMKALADGETNPERHYCQCPCAHRCGLSRSTISDLSWIQVDERALLPFKKDVTAMD
jgi:hypothetical protein